MVIQESKSSVTPNGGKKGQKDYVLRGTERKASPRIAVFHVIEIYGPGHPSTGFEYYKR